MLLSVGMIYQELAQYFSKAALNGQDVHMNLERYSFYDDELTLRSDTLYLFTSEITEAQLEMLTVEEGTALILPNDIRSDPHLPASVLILKPGMVSIFHLANRIQTVFEKYQKYEDALKSAIYSNKSIQYMVSLATTIFGNELTIRNCEYRIIAKSYSEVKQYAQSGMPQPLANGMLPPEILDALKRDKEYQAAIPSKKPRPYFIEELQSSGLCYDLFEHNRFLFRIRLAAVNGPLHVYDSELLLHFAELIRSKYYSDDLQSEGSPLYSIFYRLLNTPSECTETDILTLKREIQWQIYGTFICGCLSLSPQDMNLNVTTYYCSLIRQRIQDIFALQCGQYIVLIANLDLHYEDSDLFFNDITMLIREENMRAGFSLEFNNLTQLQFFYHQAKSALEIGKKKNPDFWIHYFQNYLCSYLEQQLTRDFGSVSFCDRTLKILQDYDSRKEAGLLHTLKVYLDCNQNVTQASKLLYINRGTLLYRLNKIRELTGIDYNQTESLLLTHLFLTLAVSS